MFQRFRRDYDLKRIGLARTIIHRTFGRFGMHGADHDPPLEGEWPFLETVDVAASPDEYGFKFWRQSDCLSPQGRDFRIAQHDLLKGLASRSTLRGASSGG